MPVDRPPYVTPIADPVEEPPYYFGTEDRPWISCLLPLPTKEGALDRLCETFLNEPLRKNCNSDVSFKPVGDKMMCTINLYQQAGSLPQPHEGWVEYLEITFMFKVRRHHREEPLDKLGWFLPTLFLDGTEKTGSRSVIYAITGGREIFGLAKTAGAIKFKHNRGFHELKKAKLRVIDLPEGQKDPAALSLQEVLRVSALTAPAAPEDVPDLSHIELIAKLLNVEPEDLDVDPSSGQGLLRPLDLRFDANQVFGGPLVGLKQFHDATDYPKASFQAVVESDFRVVSGSYKSPLYTDHVVRFKNSENVRLVDDLGLDVDGNNEVVVAREKSIYMEASATFGDPCETEVWGCR